MKVLKILEKILQWTINILVIAMVISLWVVPYIQNLQPYDYITIPDEVATLDLEIDDVLLNSDSNFEELYLNRSNTPATQLTYLPASSSVLRDADNFEKSVNSLVYITTSDSDEWIYFGSGSIISADGIIVTNYHVLEDSQKVVVSLYDGRHFPLEKVIASDELLDITVIKIDAENLTPLPIGDSDTVRVGDKTLVIGHAEGFLNTLSVGNVAGFRGYESQGAGVNIQITNPISGGNSGGVVLNEKGELIGVPAWSLEYDDNSVQVQNLNFAVQINDVVDLLQRVE